MFSVMVESVVLSLVGGLLGALTGISSARLLRWFAHWNAVSAASVLLSFISAAGVGIIFGVWPARRAARLNPVDALRYE